MTKKSDWFWLLVSMILFITSGFLAGIIYSQNIAPFLTLNENINITQNCSNLSLLDTSTCLQQEVLPFFYYNITNKGKQLTIKQLKLEGGTCSSWANYYETRLKEIGGFYTTQVIIPSGDKLIEKHQFLVMSSKEGWCFLDQTWKDCVFFKQGNESI